MDACTNGLQALDALALVYDVGDWSTFTVLPEIYQKSRELSGKVDFPVVVVANKVDLFQPSREVDADRGRELAEAIGGVYGECSAREGDEVRQTIQDIMKLGVKARLHSLEQQDLQSLRERDMLLQKEQGQSSMSRRAKMKRSMSQKIMSRLSNGNG